MGFMKTLTLKYVSYINVFLKGILLKSELGGGPSRAY
jgi:hypothetical protein